MAATLRQDVCDLSNPRGSVGRVRASIVRQGDIPDHDAKSTKELKKTRTAADTAPARPGFAGRVFWMRASARSAPRYARRRVFQRNPSRPGRDAGRDKAQGGKRNAVPPDSRVFTVSWWDCAGACPTPPDLRATRSYHLCGTDLCGVENVLARWSTSLARLWRSALVVTLRTFAITAAV